MDGNQNLKQLFFPYYINQPRLLDLYAILNGGLAEYEEVKLSHSEANKKNGSARAEGSSGFRLFKIGGSFEAELEKASSKDNSSIVRKVQTLTSMLDLVIRELREKGYMRPIEESQPGVFVITPVKLRINSIKALVKEAEELVELGGRMQALDASTAKKTDKSDLRSIKAISNVVRDLFGAEEFVSENEKYAVFGTVVDDYLYQAIRGDIINTDLHCLAQIKNVFPQGTQLMKNTVFTKFQDSAPKEDMINALKSITDGSDFLYESDAITEIVNKPVYELEVIALYQAAESTTGNTG